MSKTNEELVEKRVQRYGMAYEGILPKDAIERSKDFWRNELLDLAEEINTAKDAACKERVKKIEKAYGGCHYCYGKGYGTQTAAWEGRGYYKKLPTMKFCTCERGEQLKSLLTPPLPDQGDSK